jgi:hypothetical protein
VSAVRVVGGGCCVGWDVFVDDVVGLFQGVGVVGVGGGCAVL